MAWLHSEKGTLAVYPNVITQNDRISLKHDNRHAYYLHLRDIQESDAGKYICQVEGAIKEVWAFQHTIWLLLLCNHHLNGQIGIWT